MLCGLGVRVLNYRKSLPHLAKEFNKEFNNGTHGSGRFNSSDMDGR